MRSRDCRLQIAGLQIDCRISNLQSICNLKFCNAVKWEDMALVGRIARPHGIRGQVIVNPETDFPEERFQPGAELFIERGGEVAALTGDDGAVSPGAAGHRD